MVFGEVDEQDRGKILEKFPEAILDGEMLTEEKILEQYRNAEVLCVFIYSQVTRKVLENLPNLKLVVTRSVGYNHIDLVAARERGVVVCNVPDYGSHVIAEHVFALLLSTIRCVKEGDDRTEQCNFDFHGLRGVALKDKKLGIVGTGKIGKNVARIASMGFLMDVLAYDKYPDEEAALSSHFRYVNDLEDIWRECDIISLHVPLFPETEHLVNDETIGKMKDGVILVNTARGEILDTDALVRGVKSGKIAYAALDVLEHEKNIAKNREILSLPQVMVTPHIAFYADDSMGKMYEEAFGSIDRFLSGEKLVHRVCGE